MITIDEAIKNLTKLERTLAPTMAASGTDALKLGIEGLKKWKEYRTCDKVWWGNLLPGETSEVKNEY